MRCKDDTYCIPPWEACIYTRATDIRSKNYKGTSTIREKQTNKKKRILLKEKYNTTKQVVATAVLIDILRFTSVSSSFSIHLSTYTSECLRLATN